jgi:Ulp1 family protease
MIARLIDLKVPMQPNTDDCGLYVLHFARVFLQDPVKMCQKMSDSVGVSWGAGHVNEMWEHLRLPEMRHELRNIILE